MTFESLLDSDARDALGRVLAEAPVAPLVAELYRHVGLRQATLVHLTGYDSAHVSRSLRGLERSPTVALVALDLARYAWTVRSFTDRATGSDAVRAAARIDRVVRARLPSHDASAPLPHVLP